MPSEAQEPVDQKIARQVSKHQRNLDDGDRIQAVR